MATTVERTTTERAVVPAAGAAPWYRDRIRLSVAGAAAAAAIGLGVWLVATSGARKEQFGARELNKARAEAEGGNLPKAAADLQRVIEQFRGTDAAMEATLALNQVRLINGQNELAVVSLRDFIGSKPASKYATPGYGLLGTALENSRKPADAGDAFTKASEMADAEYLKAEYLVSAGRAYRNAGKLPEAEKAYRTIQETFGKTPAATEAQVRLGELTKGKTPP